MKENNLQNRQEERIYENVDNFSPILHNKLPQCNLLPNSNRDRHIKELVDTERNYIDVLNMMSRYFMRPLKMLMKPEEHLCVFSQIKLLTDLHMSFYSELYNCIQISGLSNACISVTFFDWGLFFIIYGKYVANLDRAQFIIADLIQKSRHFNEVRQKCEELANQSKFKLADLIAIPFQRILKYHLLLKEIVNSTVETHQDYNHIEKAYKFMLDISDYLNEAKRDSEMMDKIAAIEMNMIDFKMLKNASLVEYGRLLKNKSIRIKSSFDDDKIKKRYVFLFERAIILCKPIESAKFIFKECLLLSDFDLVQDLSSNPILYTDANKQNVFYLVDKSKNLKYTFYPKTEEIRKNWIQSIELALDSICPKNCKNNVTNHKFVIQSFDKGTFCELCELLFKGLYYQGYKCTACSISVHKNCIPLARPCDAIPKPINLSPTILRLKQKFFADKTFRLKLDAKESIKSNEKQIEDYDWYAHTMEQEIAERILMQMVNDTYLVRIVLDQGIYAISVRDSEHIKHIYILENNRNQLYLNESKYFDDIIDLIDYYSKNSLADVFPGLTITLRFPFRLCFKFNITNENKTQFNNDLIKRAVSYCRAKKDFSGGYPQLSFKKGDLIEILDKKHRPQGWYKGRIGTNVGYVPVSFLHLETADKDQVI